MLNPFQTATLIAFSANVVMGFSAFLMNPLRRANRYFFLATGALGLWLGGLTISAFLKTEAPLMFWIRFVSVTSAILPPTFDLLRMAITEPEAGRPRLFRRMALWLPLYGAAVVICLWPSFVLHVEFGENGFGKPVHGAPMLPLAMYWVAALSVLAFRFSRGMRSALGLARAELEFVVLGFVAGALVGVSFAYVLPAVTGNRDLMQFMPISVVVFEGIVAYGIVTRRIMSVGDVLRRAAAYTLLCCSLGLVYIAVLAVVDWGLRLLFDDPGIFPYLVATLAVVFSMAPARGAMQGVANRLFLNLRHTDVAATLQQGQRVLMSISTTAELQTRFAGIISHVTGSDRVYILLREGVEYVQSFPVPEPGEAALRVKADCPVIQRLEHAQSVVSVDAIRRMRASRESVLVLEWMGAWRVSLAVGIPGKESLDGVLLVGPRLSGRIYGAVEQDMLQLLCSQLSVAMENASFYTKMRNSKIYNDILLDSLRSAVVAADGSSLTVTVFNREAQQITGLPAGEVVGQSADKLPAELTATLRRTLDTRQGCENVELRITRAGGIQWVRLSSSVFCSHTGEVLGALAVFQDITEIRKLEEQVRRTDRLASLGTLAAGMAHEIKNPLVTIKTFTQLLPEKKDDPEFQSEFTVLVGGEIQRIDRIVAQLLNFARPTEPDLSALGVHSVLSDSLRLVGQQLLSRGIRLTRDFGAGNDRVFGDADMLSQAFVNLYLNAMAAMPSGGELKITTQELLGRFVKGAGEVSGREGLEQRWLQVQILDTGTGIRPEDLPHIFDPFFTTRSEGTGMGLAVCHRIFQQHQGYVEVQSERGKGTVFTVFLPLLREKSA